jgi:hypothetical protein
VIRVALLLLLAAPTLDRKFTLIQQGHLKPGTRIVMTRDEWNAWVQDEVPEGVTKVRMELGTNRVIAAAQVDFGTLSGVSLLQGPRPVTVTARLQSEGGRARVDIERVQVAGVAVQGRALDFLIQQYVIPNYPDAKVAQWFPLRYHMDRIEIRPTSVTVLIK